MIKKYIGVFLSFLGLILLSYYFYSDTIFLYPSHIHAWTQSDRYAIALNFLRNHFDIFHPATYNLLTVNGITQVDFPINEWVIALLMKLSHHTSPIIFRTYTLCYSYIGLYFLFLLAKDVTQSAWKSVVMVLFVYTSPVYTYYQAGFLPSIPAFANVIIGFYFFNKFCSSKKDKHLFLSVGFLTLAALVRLPYIIFLIGVCLQIFNTNIRQKIFFNKLFITILTGISIVIAYFLYNKYLGYKYGSMFLTFLLPINSWETLNMIFDAIRNHWILEYFTIFHYTLILIGIILYIVAKRKNNIPFGSALVFSLIGVCLFFIAMGQQFIDHDYYFLDSFYPLIILGFLILLNAIEFKKKIIQLVLASIFLCTTIIAIGQSEKVQQQRYTSGNWDKYNYALNNFKGSKEYLNSIGIPENARMLVIDAYSTNMPLILMNRNGYTILNTDSFNMTNFMKYDFDYAVIQNNIEISGVIGSYPAMINMLNKIGDNGKISIYKKCHPLCPKSLKEFLGITHENILYSQFFDFETKQEPAYWNNLNHISIDPTHMTQHTAYVNTTIKYGASFNIPAQAIRLKGSEKIFIQFGLMLKSDIQNVKVVASLSNQNGQYYYNTFDTIGLIKNIHGWNEIAFQFSLPDTINMEDELSVYIWNSTKANLLYDDLELIIYK